MAACGNEEPEADTSAAETDTSTEDTSGNVSDATLLDAFEIESRTPFVIADEEMVPRRGGFIENGKYIADIVYKNRLIDGFYEADQETVSSHIEDQFVEAADYGNPNAEIDTYELKPLDFAVFKKEDGLQVPIMEPRQKTTSLKIHDLNSESFTQHIQDEGHGSMLTNEPTNSILYNVLASGTQSGKAIYKQLPEIVDPEKFLEDTTESERDSLFPTFTSIDTSTYENWILAQDENNEQNLLI